MFLSIIIPIYNVELYLENCLDSIANTNVSQEEYEVIVVNDGSTDNSYEIALKYASKIKNFKCFNQSNKGVSKTRNFALQQAEGTYVFFLDSDDHFKKDSFNKLMEVVQSEEEVDLFLLDNKYPKKRSLYTTNQLISEHFFSAYLWKACFRRDFLKQNQIQFLEGYILEDGIFILESVLKAKSIATQSLDLVEYTYNPTSYMRDTTNKEKNHQMIVSFVHVIKIYEDLIEQYKDKLSDRAVYHLNIRRESFVFFFISRMIRFGYSSKEVKKNLKEVGFIKFHHFPGKFYPSLQFKILSKIFEHSSTRLLLSSFISLKKNMS